MPRVPYNSVGGFSTGLTMTNVIDSTGNITGVGATFSGLIRANAGISASGATFSGNISAPNIVTSVNGATGSVTTYAGTTGNIQFRYGSGVTATNYFGLTVGNLGQITDILTLSGATVGFDAYFNGNNEALGLQFERGVYGLGMDEAGGVAISAKGIYDEGGPSLYGASLSLITPSAVDGGSNIYFRAAGSEQFIISPTSILSNAPHLFGFGINSYSAGYTNSFEGPITGVTATFTGLLSASKGISAAGGVTFSGNFSGATGSFSRLLTASGGINAAGAAFSSDVYANASLYTDYIQHGTSEQLNIDNVSGGRVAIGDYDQNGNNTSIFLRDIDSTIDIINPYGEIRMGDINALSTGFYIYYYPDEARLTGNSSSITDFASIFANEALYENNRRVTTNARSWFL
jgi:hypothetical protein